MTVLTTGVRYVDLNFLEVPGVIATAVIEAPDGITLIDPGPSSCLPALRGALDRLGIRLADVTTLLLTHIHLDHAGCTGSLVREQPALRVFVQARGARHLAEPSKLIDSARRLYGERMDTMWGEIVAIPPENLRSLAGGERIEAGGRRFDVAYTPGHASHHVSYFDSDSGLAFVGDTCGARIGTSQFVMPPTPPPDIDLAAWHESLDRILAWAPATLFLTHFGASEQPQTHVEELRARLEWSAGIVRDALQQHPDPDEDASAAAIFEQQMRTEMRRHMIDAEALAYSVAVPLDHCYQGLARYWRKRAAGHSLSE
jgi:glyoxylase-like metal-dependent hydrolase (beta-lactamase superfamily II)